MLFRSENTIKRIIEKEGLKNDKNYFAISIRPWKTASGDFYEKIASLCDHISKKYNMTAVFIPMQQGFDIEANRRIAERMNSEHITIKGVYGADELLGVISKMRLVIGMRLHILIYAAAANVPVFGLSYDPKIDSVLSYLCQHYKEKVENASLEKMIRGVDEIMEDRKSVV